MTQNLSAAQQAQLENRDASGQFQQKTHGDVDDQADVLGIGSAEDRFNRTMAMDDLEIEREKRDQKTQLDSAVQEHRAKQAQLTVMVREDESRAQSSRSVRDLINAHDMLDELRDHNVATVEMTPYSDGGGGHYISSAEDNDGRDISEDQELESIVYGHNIDVENVAEQADLPTDIAGSVILDTRQGLGEEFTRERLEAQRDEIIARLEREPETSHGS